MVIMSQCVLSCATELGVLSVSVMLLRGEEGTIYWNIAKLVVGNHTNSK